MMAPEFSRPIAIETIGEAARPIAIEADEAERAALARRFACLAIDRLAADLRVSRRAGAFWAEGRVVADVVQECVATGDALAVTIDEALVIRFLPAPEEAGEEIELSADACDVMFYDGPEIDLGEAVAETMALALEPFPRGPNAERALKAAGVIGEDEVRPSGALAGLKDMLGG